MRGRSTANNFSWTSRCDEGILTTYYNLLTAEIILQVTPRTEK